MLSGDDVDNLVNLSRSVKARFLVDMDLQLRFGTQWDPKNALDFLQYLQSREYGENIDFELGNGKVFFYSKLIHLTSHL